MESNLKNKPRKNKTYFLEHLLEPNDKNYDRYGRDLKEQRSRQNKVPWIKVRHDHRGRLIISDDKREQLKTLEI